MEGKTIIAVIVAGVSYMAINKWIWTPMKRRPNPIRKDDNDPAASLPSPAAEASSSSPPPPEQKDDPASLPSPAAEASSSSSPHPPEQKDDPASLPSSSAEASSSPPPPPEQKDNPASLPSSSAEVSSSSPPLPPPPPPKLEYDVFLSFRGADTRKGITSDLYDRLRRRGIKTFMDDPVLEVGDAISPTLIAAIEKSRFAIVVLSRDYASSIWCLEELTKICQCMEDKNRILPLFYDVEPSDVRYQKNSFEEPFSKHEASRRYESEKMQRWRDALSKVATFSGWTTQNYKTHNELVDEIVQFLCKKVVPDTIESTGDFEEYEATRQAMDDVMKALKDDEPTIIGIYGIGGVGKTTMVKHVAAEAKRQGLFGRVLTAVISHTPDFRNIQGILADQLGVKLGEETNDGRAVRLSREIFSKDKTLIILDDIWERIKLTDIGIPCDEDLQNCRSKVLLTTRSLEVCNSMDSQPKIVLRILSEEDSWKLFVKKTRMSSEEVAGFHDVARSVAGECGGLPIALVAIATALRDKNLNVWKKAAGRLKSSQPSNVGDERDLFKCIKLSYDYLRSEDAKSLFLLCCLFPEDYDIQIENLLMYGIGKGLFKECNTLQEARSICHSEVEHLISSSLLLGTKNDGPVRMHDVIRDVAIYISSEDGQRVWVGAGHDERNWPKINAGTYAISLMMNKIRSLPGKLVCSKLQILLLQHNLELEKIPDSFFQSLIELKVLDLSKTNISSLPPSSCLLNSLCLDSCEKLFDMSALGKLQKLEILSLRECCPPEVPKEIGKLINLRMLDISESQVVKIAPNVMSCLIELEELYMQCKFGDWGSKVEEAGEGTNAGFDELTGLLYLNTLNVGISDAKLLPKDVEVNPTWEHFDICISTDDEVRKSTWKPHFSRDRSRTLTLSTTIHSLPDWFINVVTEKAEKLQYRKCMDLKNILIEYHMGKLHALKYLVIFGCHGNLEELMNAETQFSYTPVFQNLEELHLCEVDDLKNLCVGDLPLGSLCNLKLLDIRRYGWIGICVWIWLQEMRLFYLPELIKIWDGYAPHAIFHNLKLLAVSECKKLQSLITSDVAQHLSQLEDLWVYSCFSLDRVVEASEETGKRIVIFPKLKNLVLVDLPRLRWLYNNSSGSATSLVIEFPLLEHFLMWECPRFSSGTSSSYNQKQVQVNDFRHYSFLKKRLWGNYTLSGNGRWKYDVFLSSSGADTCKGISITYDLYSQLYRRQIKTFKGDEEPEARMVISPTVLNAIEESRLAIIVLSQTYASSTCCLDELATICQCMEDNNRILPLFYHVDPTEIRYQTETFEDALIKHEKSGQHSLEKLQLWRDALKRVVNISGWHTQNYKDDRQLVEGIVEFVCNKVLPAAIQSMEDFQEFEATRKAMDEVMNALTDDEVNAVGVYGMRGVGKTTMVKHVGAEACKNGIFHHVIMAVVSQNPNFEKLQDTLAEQLGFKLWEQTKIERIARLNKEIMRREKLLIILDDIWNTLPLSSIGIPGYNELQICNSKLLFTTTRLNVCHVMACQAKIRLSILSEDDAWYLFLKKARRSFQKSTPFYEVARKVARECAGLPVALIAVARALGDKEFEDWKEAARRLQISQPANEEKDVFECIKLSYDYLDSVDAKSCFLLCCLFPEDYDIQIEDLMKYGFGTGLFRDANSTIEYARARANSVTKYLKASCLLLDGAEEGCVRMHDVIRDIAVSIAFSVDVYTSVKTLCHLKDWSMDADQGYSAISLIESNICKLPNKLVCSKLQILLLQQNLGIREIPTTFFPSPNDLRVLDLSNTSISSLPPSLSLLTRLQALHLDHCKYMIDISMLGKLKNLEILSMRGCSIEKFPKEIGNLTNLRMLDLNHTSFGTVPAQVIPRLYRLEELYMNCYFDDWGSEVDEGYFFRFPHKNADFDELIGLSCLNTLEVSICGVECLPQNVEFNPNWNEFYVRISRSGFINFDWELDFRHRSSRALTIDTTMNNLPDWFISVVTERTYDLWYSDCNGLNLLEEHDRGRLHALKHLCIDSSCAEVLLNTVTWPRVSNEPVLENLEELKIRIGPHLEELCVGDLPPGSIRNLKILNMQDCHRLVKPLLRSKLLHRLESLEELACSHMHSMKYVFGFEGHEPKDVVLTKLRMISLRRVHKLRNIWDGPAPPGIFQSLKIFSLIDCRELKYLFTSVVARCLSQLEDLWVEDCHSLDRIIEASEETESNKIVLLQLKNLLLKGLPKLTRLSSTSSSTIDIEIECPSLEHLHVYACPQFSISASDFNSSNEVQLDDDQHWSTLRGRIHNESKHSHFPL